VKDGRRVHLRQGNGKDLEGVIADNPRSVTTAVRIFQNEDVTWLSSPNSAI
jgi:hypothetical protein